MKKLLFLSGLIVLTCTSVVSAQAGSKENGLAALLSSYYHIKNSLVNSDAAKVASNATGFVNALKAVDSKALSETESNAFTAIQEKLKADAQLIA
ncbi:MAG: DUF3347 domain-containing protein, partial [Ferruginibacter sp.]